MENKVTFEEAYKKLEDVAEKLQSPEITLDEAIELFAEGVKLSKHCDEILENAKQKIEILEKGKE